MHEKLLECTLFFRIPDRYGLESYTVKWIGLFTWQIKIAICLFGVTRTKLLMVETIDRHFFFFFQISDKNLLQKKNSEKNEFLYLI
jgi:hypothetical protein